MWTNIFRIGGLQQISWFQFLPIESETSLRPEKDKRHGIAGVKAEPKETATLEVLSAHLQLQKEGFLSTWTNSFVGPWDPSQGIHNPDEKIKLWLFIPGRHSSISEKAQLAVSRLRVVASGVWSSPGNSEEVATALSQALKNRLERELLGLSYVRFGDVFSKYRPFSPCEQIFRKGQPTIEFIFAASEEAIYVHVILSTKHVRTLCSGDMEKVLKLSSDSHRQRLPVIVSPHGMRGKITGCCSSDLVKHVYDGSATSRASTGLVGLQERVGCKSQGQNCYIEVTLGYSVSGSTMDKSNCNGPTDPTSDTASIARGSSQGSSGDVSSCEKTFIYPTDAVLVPVLRTSCARASCKRFWIQNWAGQSFSSSTLFMHSSGTETEYADDSWSESDGIWLQHALNSSSNSNSSSISSLSSSSSDSEYKTNATSGDLEADADSLTGRQSGLSSLDPMEISGPKQGAKRPRAGVESGLMNVSTQDYNNSGVTGVANEQVGSHWDWEDDERGVGMDIQALLSEFGDFGDFFENDALPFGEPPGTAESQALMFPGQECGDGVGSPSAGMMDVSDQMLLQYESFDTPSVMEECVTTVQEATKSTLSSVPVNCEPSASTGEFDHVIKAEALLTFAPEYGAVETSYGDHSSTIFRSPYLPKCQKAESSNSSVSNYVYGATPPSSPCISGVAEKAGIAGDSRVHSGKHGVTASLPKYYTQVESSETAVDGKALMCKDTIISSDRSSSLTCSFNNANAAKSVQNANEVTSSAKYLLLSESTVPGAELECLMFQAAMCKIRHTLVSTSSRVSNAWNRSMGSMGLSELPGHPSSMTDSSPIKYEVKKEAIPVRIAGDIGGILDNPINAPIGVWRSVGAPKPVKPANTPTSEVYSSLSHHPFNDESMVSYGQRQPLQDFLDAISLLVQQATSFVDVALDGEFAEGPYGWLALQEQQRRGFCCGPHMVHAGCGGILASCHSFDIAGIELHDPISADVQTSSVMGLLQSDIKTALKSAFSILDGPLSVIDWCKGHQSGDTGLMSDAISAESSVSEYKDSSCTTMTVGDPVSPSQPSASVSSGLKDSSKGDDSGQRRSNQDLCMLESEQQLGYRRRPILFVTPYPSILVGYQDDWLKTSASSLQLWEKAPLEPYAFQKHMSYYVVCPNIDPLTSAAADFFQQLGTVYEACKLGTHSPHIIGNQMEVDAGKCLTSGFVLVDNSQSIKTESNTAAFPVGSISDYFLSLSNGWNLASFLRSLKKVLKTLQLGSCSSTEGRRSPCTVVYVVCPFPDPVAVLRTVVESSVALGSVVLSSESDKRSLMYTQIGKTLSSSAGVDETAISNIPTLSGFSIPRLVLQIVPVDAIFRVMNSRLNELVLLKEIAFTVYNKARCISRGQSADVAQSSNFSGRSHSMMMHMTNPIPNMWKECVGSRMSGPSLPREGELDPGSRAAGTWDNTWQTGRVGGLGCDPNRSGDHLFQEEPHYMFEPLFILAEPGSVEQGVSPTFIGNVGMEFTKQGSDDSCGGFMQSSATGGDVGPSCQIDSLEADGYGSKSPPSLHCCYGWTEDWRWLVCIWTDSRGELLDNHIFPFGGISSRQDTKGMQNLFVQILQQGCQILQACSSDSGTCRPRDLVITRIGCFYELECQEWQKALYSIGGSEVKKWPLQLRRGAPDGLPTSGNGASQQQQQEIERSLPSSPSPVYSSSPHAKSSGFMKGAALGQPSGRKQLIGGSTTVDGSRGSLQWVQSISFVSVSVDHSLHLVSQADTSSGSTQGNGVMGALNYLEGFSHVKSLGSTSASYLLVPSPSMRFLTPNPLQLPTCLTSESPPLAHLLHSKGSAIPLSTGFIVSKAVPSFKKDADHILKEEWPSVLSVNLIDYYGGCGVSSDKLGRVVPKQGGQSMVSDAREYELETHMILESLLAELHALSWMTVSPAYLERRSALPFHCDMVLRLRRLLHFAEKETSVQPEKQTVPSKKIDG